MLQSFDCLRALLVAVLICCPCGVVSRGHVSTSGIGGAGRLAALENTLRRRLTQEAHTEDRCNTFISDVPATLLGIDRKLFGRVRVGTGGLTSNGSSLVRLDINLTASNSYIANRNAASNVRVCFTRKYPHQCPLSAFMYHVGITAEPTQQLLSALVPVPQEVWNCSSSLEQPESRGIFVEVQVDVASKPNGSTVASPYAGDSQDSMVDGCPIIYMLATCNPSKCGNGTVIDVPHVIGNSKSRVVSAGLVTDMSQVDTLSDSQRPDATLPSNSAAGTDSRDASPQPGGSSGGTALQQPGNGTSDSSSSSAPIGAIVGGVIGGLAVVGVTAGAYIVVKRRRISAAGPFGGGRGNSVYTSTVFVHLDPGPADNHFNAAVPYSAAYGTDGRGGDFGVSAWHHDAWAGAGVGRSGGGAAAARRGLAGPGRLPQSSPSPSTPTRACSRALGEAASPSKEAGFWQEAEDGGGGGGCRGVPTLAIALAAEDGAARSSPPLFSRVRRALSPRVKD